MDSIPYDNKENKFTEASVKIISEDQKFCVGKFPGTAITGFIDVEKFVTLNKHTFFLEKKLPFQILIIAAQELL
ncbi:MAG TPA: hypothetical protein DDW65_03620 [Firmicutes bacterium]|jgi:hypothetical protein|nr:hypothetical protein [Bacillota bacterium]